MPAVRRLAAILAADVAGYSRLMGADEEGTHERLKLHRREFIDLKISERSGRIVKTTGDGMLAEFPSVVDAMRCAAEWQRAMIDREACGYRKSHPTGADDEAPRYLIRDRDTSYGAAVTRRLQAMGIRDRPITPCSPWQNGHVERLIGSIRRECLDHVVVLGERHPPCGLHR